MTEAAKQQPKRAVARSAARMATVQALYQMDMAGTDLNDIIREFCTERLNDPDAEDANFVSGADQTFMAELLRGVVRRQIEIDPLIDQQLAEGWRLARVDSILRAILRAATVELFERPDVPARVVINEYIELARAFFDEDEPTVVNGVLDSLARKLRAKEFETKKNDWKSD
jgi:N utilization substance protein B